MTFSELLGGTFEWWHGKEFWNNQSIEQANLKGAVHEDPIDFCLQNTIVDLHLGSCWCNLRIRASRRRMMNRARLNSRPCPYGTISRTCCPLLAFPIKLWVISQFLPGFGPPLIELWTISWYFLWVSSSKRDFFNAFSNESSITRLGYPLVDSRRFKRCAASRKSQVYVQFLLTRKIRHMRRQHEHSYSDRPFDIAASKDCKSASWKVWL